MRYFIGMQMGWAAVPFIALIGVAYMFVVDRLITRKTTVVTRKDVPSVAKAA